jgi:hypothetical protein
MALPTMARTAVLLGVLPAATAAAAAHSGTESSVAYIVEARVDQEPILAYRGYGPSNADWQQVRK